MFTPFEVRKPFLWTRVAVFPDLCVVFFRQISKAMISGELQLTCATTSICSRGDMMQKGLLVARWLHTRGKENSQPTVISEQEAEC